MLTQKQLIECRSRFSPTKEQALELGKTQYISTKACGKCNRYVRYLKSEKCVSCTQRHNMPKAWVEKRKREQLNLIRNDRLKREPTFDEAYYDFDSL